MKRTVFQVLVLSLLFICCSTGGNGESDHLTIEAAQVLTVDLPGNAIEPGGDTVKVPPDTAVLLYYWLPLEKYPAMEEDLMYLASIDSSVLVLPLQFDEYSRNHAQRLVNDLAISLPVYLADSVLGSSLELNVLPFSALFLPEGDVLFDDGFGSPARLLGNHMKTTGVPRETPENNRTGE